MNTARIAPAPPLQHDGGPWVEHPAAAQAGLAGHGLGNLPNERGFEAMRSVFRATGGVARADDLARLLEDRRGHDGVSLSERIESGQVLGFHWLHRLWVPMFQFDLRNMALKPATQQVRAVLSGTCHAWAVALWLMQRNGRLQYRRPIDLLDADLPAVLKAARANRDVAAG